MNEFDKKRACSLSNFLNKFAYRIFLQNCHTSIAYVREIYKEVHLQKCERKCERDFVKMICGISPQNKILFRFCLKHKNTRKSYKIFSEKCVRVFVENC